MPKVVDEKLIAMTIMVAPGLKSWLEREADVNYRNTSAEVRKIIEEERDRRQQMEN